MLYISTSCAKICGIAKQSHAGRDFGVTHLACSILNFKGPEGIHQCLRYRERMLCRPNNNPVEQVGKIELRKSVERDAENDLRNAINDFYGLEWL